VKNHEKLITISKEDVAFIMGKSYKYFAPILQGAYCNTCKSTHTSTITNFKLFLNFSNNVIIDGYCDKCHSHLIRTVETGEKFGASERAEITRIVKVELLDYIS